MLTILVAETSKITESRANTANMSETCIVSASRNDIITRLLRKARGNGTVLYFAEKQIVWFC